MIEERIESGYNRYYVVLNLDNFDKEKFINMKIGEGKMMMVMSFFFMANHTRMTDNIMLMMMRNEIVDLQYTESKKDQSFSKPKFHGGKVR